MVDSDRNEGKDYFEINRETGEIFTKVMFDREKQGAYALEVEARDGAPSARPNSNGQPNSGMSTPSFSPHAFDPFLTVSKICWEEEKKSCENLRVSNLVYFSCISEEKDRMNLRIFCRFGQKMAVSKR